MRKLASTLFIAATALSVLSPLSVLAQADAPVKVNSTGGKSPHETTSVVLGARGTDTRVTISYGRPYAKGRTVWGTLVKWNEADRLGSDEATLLLTQGALQIGDATIPAGAYTLYIVASEKGPSKLAISSNIGKWGIPVDTKHDVARVDLTTEAATSPAEQLTITLPKSPNGGGMIKIAWADTVFSVPIASK